MTRSEVDQLLPQLQELRDRVAAALLAMDANGGLAVLRTAQPTGATADLWREVKPRIDALWDGLGTLARVVDAATALRGTGLTVNRAHLDDLTTLLREQVALDQVPDRYRDCTAAQLALLLDADCQATTTDLSGLEAKVKAVSARFTELEAGLTAAGSPQPQAKELAELRAEALSDPLGADLDESRLRSLAKTIHELAAVRRGYPGRRAALVDALRDLALAESAAGDAYALASAKIHDPRLPDARQQEPALRHRLESFDRLDVVALDQALPALEQAVSAAVRGAAERRRFAEGLLERRDELRGRLEAYRMKAVRIGRSEQQDVLAGYATARSLLWTAPCDLSAATRAVVAFQRSILDGPEGGAA